MREYYVTLPLTITEEAFQQELSFYGIGSHAENVSKISSNQHQGFQTIFSASLHHDRQIAALNRNIKHLEYTKSVRILAKQYADNFFKKLKGQKEFNIPSDIHMELATQRESIDAFKNVYNEHGLTIVQSDLIPVLETMQVSLSDA
jgi:hypothetical protein